MFLDNGEIEGFLQVGRTAIFQSKDDALEQYRYKTTFRGWKRNAYIIIEQPTGVELPFRRGMQCIVRFLADGRACAFDTAIQEMGSGQFYPFIQVDWPSSMNCVNVRKAERVPLRVPCRLAHPGAPKPLEAQIIDLSEGGCKIVCPAALDAKTDLRLDFELPDGSVISNLSATVCNCIQQTEHSHIGCSFPQDHPFLHEIGLYISTTLERMRLHDVPKPRVVIVADDLNDLVPLCNQFAQTQWDATTVKGPVDGFFRIRLSRPDAVMINRSLSDLNGFEMCRVLRQFSPLENVPLILFGCKGGSDEAEGKKAGANLCIPMETDVAGIVDSVKGLVDRN